MKIRAKFSCIGVRKSRHWKPENGFLYEAELSAVTSGSEENEKFWAATPSGSIKLSTIREDYFVPGWDYYVEFTPVEEA